ncbi:MAG: ribonuclease HII [bacterium]
MKFVIGSDEVGRGALAGPVAVGAVAVPRGVRCQVSGVRCKLRDSKKLTQRQRGLWFEYFKSHPRIIFTIAWVYPRQIEKRNIAKAANLAAMAPNDKHFALSAKHAVYLDGGLYLGNNRRQARTLRGPTRTKLSNGIVAVTMPGGDEKFNAIKIASIIAKVTRDRAMVRLAKKYPRYGFEMHKGYGTKAHMRAIKRHGPSKHHRLTFIS